MFSKGSDLVRVLMDEKVISQRINDLANQISKDYSASDKLYIVGILKGAFIFLSDLTRALTIPHTIDFMALSSYGMKGSRSDPVRILMDLRESIEDKHVLIVEDIIDSGHTIEYLQRTLNGRGPASLRTCVFLHKITKQSNIPLDYVGFEIQDVWVVGYGLDYAERYRTLPYVAEFRKPAKPSEE